MSALITGVAGFIGSHLAERLVGSGVSVVGADGFTTYYDPSLKRRNVEALAGSDRFRLVEGNLRDLDLSELLDGVDVVYHLAAQPGVRRSWGREFEIYLNENLLATQLLLEAVRNTEVRRFVFASSSSVYGDAERLPTRESDTPRPVSPYGVTKLAGEHLCHLYFSRFDVPTVPLRYFTVFGPRQRPDMAFTRFIQAATDDTEIEVFGDGLQSRDFTYVDDAVSATIAAGEKGRPRRGVQRRRRSASDRPRGDRAPRRASGPGSAGTAPAARAGRRPPHRGGHREGARRPVLRAANRLEGGPVPADRRPGAAAGRGGA